jgi:hypothetical protein
LGASSRQPKNSFIALEETKRTKGSKAQYQVGSAVFLISPTHMNMKRLTRLWRSTSVG